LSVRSAVDDGTRDERNASAGRASIEFDLVEVSRLQEEKPQALAWGFISLRLVVEAPCPIRYFNFAR
jgi:hypothetical protein